MEPENRVLPCDKTAETQPDPLPKKTNFPLETRCHALFPKRKKVPLVFCDLQGSITCSGQEGRSQPRSSSCVATGMGRQPGWVVPLPRPDSRLGKSFSLPQAGSRKGWAACKLGLSFWFESKAN